MTGKTHCYKVQIKWTGNLGPGTATYRSYDRSHDIMAGGKPTIVGSSDPTFRGDPMRWNPEELLVASLAACHKLWFLGLCSQAGIVVSSYEDAAEGMMIEEPDGAGQFQSVTLRPRVTISGACDAQRALDLHRQAHAMCFIARSVNFPVRHEPTVTNKAN